MVIIDKSFVIRRTRSPQSMVHRTTFAPPIEWIGQNRSLITARWRPLRQSGRILACMRQLPDRQHHYPRGMLPRMSGMGGRRMSLVDSIVIDVLQYTEKRQKVITLT